MPNTIVQHGNARIVFYPQGGFSYQRILFPGPDQYWILCDDEPIESSVLLDAIRHYRPDYPIEEAMKGY